MVNGVVLVVDAYEGTMPQTKFVLKKALELSLPVIVCVNKIDRPDARPEEVVDEVLELFIDLDADEKQLDCPFIFASAKGGYASRSLDEKSDNMIPLFEEIIDYIPAPTGDPDAGTQVLISTIDYNDYVGRIGVGKVDNGSVRVNQDVVIVNAHDESKSEHVKINKLYEFDGLKLRKQELVLLSQYQESPLFISETLSALLKILLQFHSKKYLSLLFQWTLLLMTVHLPARKVNS